MSLIGVNVSTDRLFRSNSRLPLHVEGDLKAPPSELEECREIVDWLWSELGAEPPMTGSFGVITQPSQYRIRWRELTSNQVVSSARKHLHSPSVNLVWGAQTERGDWDCGIGRAAENVPWRFGLRIDPNVEQWASEAEELAWNFAVRMATATRPSHVIGYHGQLGNPYYAYSARNPPDDPEVLWGYGWLLFMSEMQIARAGGRSRIAEVPVSDIVDVGEGAMIRLAKDVSEIAPRLNRWRELLASMLDLPARIVLGDGEKPEHLAIPPIGVMAVDW